MAENSRTIATGPHPRKEQSMAEKMTDQERDLRAALKAICDLARTNFPRSTDLAVEIDAGPISSARVKIPAWLLEKLLKEATHDL